jgi:hypothetical protein
MAIKYDDLAVDSVKELIDAMDMELDNSPEPDEADEFTSPMKNQIFREKFNYSWTQEEKSYLSVIKIAAENVIIDIFKDAFNAIDDLYQQARIIKKTAGGRPEKDNQGRYVWETDRYGNYIEDWKSVSNDDLENSILKLYQAKADISDRVSTLYLEAVYAKYSYKEGFTDKYDRIIAGTVGDKTAAAEKAARKEKYKAFSRYWLWYKAEQLKREIDGKIKILTDIRGWRNWAPKN